MDDLVMEFKMLGGPYRTTRYWLLSLAPVLSNINFTDSYYNTKDIILFRWSFHFLSQLGSDGHTQW